MATRRGRREVGRPTLGTCIKPARARHRLGLEGESQKSRWMPTLLILATVAVVGGIALTREKFTGLFGDNNDLHDIEAAQTDGNLSEQGSQTPTAKIRLSEMPDVNPGEETGMDTDSGSVGE